MAAINKNKYYFCHLIITLRYQWNQNLHEVVNFVEVTFRNCFMMAGFLAAFAIWQYLVILH